ncbi:MAG: AMP-binding protein [Roseiarcus sp.]
MGTLHAGGTVGAMLLTAIERFADRPAIADNFTRWTYRDLGDAAGRLSAIFRARGLKTGDGVALIATNRVETWAVVTAAAVMGLRYTPLHPLAAEDDHAFIIEDAEIDALIVEGGKFAERGRALQSRVPNLKHLMSFGPMEGGLDLVAEMKTTEPAPLVDGGDSQAICWLAYTGGTTGRSKGVMIAHRTIVNMAAIIHADWDWPEEIRYLAATPITHAGGVNIFPTLMRGGFARVVPGFELESYCRTIQEDKINAVFLVPTLVYALIDARATRARYDLSSLQMIVYGAAPMSPDRLLEGVKIFGNVFVQFYGQTEAPQCVTTLRKVDHDPAHPRRLGSCGRPNPLMDVKLFDLDMREVERGKPGEICMRGALVMNGYWKRPEATEEAFRGGWLHSGDVAVEDEDGYYYIVDRTKDMIISGGFNIYPREVEDALMSHPSVATAAVIGVPDDKWGEAVKAFVVLRSGAAADFDALHAHVKMKRGGPWAPKSIDFVETIAVTGLGKVDRKALRAPYWQGRSRGVA